MIIKPFRKILTFGMILFFGIVVLAPNFSKQNTAHAFPPALAVLTFILADSILVGPNLVFDHCDSNVKRTGGTGLEVCKYAPIADTAGLSYYVSDGNQTKYLFEDEDAAYAFSKKLAQNRRDDSINAAR